MCGLQFACCDGICLGSGSENRKEFYQRNLRHLPPPSSSLSEMLRVVKLRREEACVDRSPLILPASSPEEENLHQQRVPHTELEEIKQKPKTRFPEQLRICLLQRCYG